MLGAVVLALLAAAVGVILALRTGGGGAAGGGPGGGGPAGGGGAAGALIRLRAVRSYDPFGNNHIENPQLVPAATDGNPSTYWATEDYYDKTLGKPGVGIILAADAPVPARTLTIVSAMPWYRAVIESGASASGPFTPDSRSPLLCPRGRRAGAVGLMLDDRIRHRPAPAREETARESRDLPVGERSLQIEPSSGALLYSLCAGRPGCEVLEIGGSRGYSTIWLGAAVRAHGGHVTSLEGKPGQARGLGREHRRRRARQTGSR